MKGYIEELSRHCSLFEIRAWHKGESTELEKWLEFGFYHTIFVSREGMVTFYYKEKEGEEFHKKLKEKLTDKFFDNLCEKFFQLIETPFNSDKEIYTLYVKMFPALTIFDEISKYPEIATENMIRRLIRVRKSTESFACELMKKVQAENNLKNYIFHKGKLHVRK